MLYYNSKKFGQTMKEIRISQNLTQKKICEKVLINQETLRKIENGIVIPKQETLDLLSIALNLDLSEMFLNYRLDNFDAFQNLKISIDEHLEDGNYKGIEEDLTHLKNIVDSNMNDFFRNKLIQLICMLEAILLEQNTQNYNLSIDKYIQALSFTLKNFTLDKYSTYYYNELELRLLMNIALAHFRLSSREQAIALIDFCINFYTSNLSTSQHALLSKLYYNMSNLQHQLGNNEKALDYAELGIQHTISARSIVALAHLYYRKGIAEFLLGKPSYLHTLTYAKNLFITSNQLNVHDNIIKACAKYYGITL